MSLTNENQDVKVPWWFNEESSRMLNGGYLLRGENLDGALERITSAAAKRLKRPDLKEKFKEIVWNGWMSLSSPIWANMGTQRGLPISCLSGDTLIEVKSGDVHLTMTIEELTKRWDEGVRNFQIKVFNTDTKTIEYSKINRVWETKKTKSLVYLSVGEAGTNNIRCTPDHLILMSNGEYKPAEEIKPLDKLQGESYKTVVEVKNIEAEEEVSVFDIEVDHPSHNFYLPEAEVFVHNCFGVNVPDSLNLISDKLKEVTMQTKIGGGTSGYFGNIRERGAKIKDNGESSGPVPFMQLFDTTMGVVSQGSCYEKGTEVLTDKGFKDFREVDPKTDKIAQLDEYNNIDFTDQYELTSKKYTGDLVKIRGRKRDDLVSIAVTTNHRMVIERMKGRKSSGTKHWAGYTEIVTAEDLRLHRDNRLYIAGKTSVMSNKFSDEDRLKIAFQADGRKDSGDTIRFRFVKERKISRLIEILDRLGLTYETKIESKSNVTNIYVKAAGKYKLPDLSWINLSEVSAEWCEDFIEELVLWDGSHDGKLRYTYCSINRINVDIVQAIASLCGKRTRITVESEREGNRQDLYSISITDNGKIQGDSCEIYREAYDDMVYCCIVPKGRILVRHEDRTLVCGNTRRGAFAAYLDIDHPDFEEFLQIRDIGNPIQNLFTGACIPDYWMQEMVDGDMEKRRIWAKVLESRQQKGMPYLFFTDNVNKNKPQVYKDNKMQITHSNLCVSGSDRVVSNYGYLTAKELYDLGTELTLFDGRNPVKSSPMKLREKDVPTYKVTLKNGMEHTITDYHKVKVVGYGGQYREVALKDLKVGDKVVLQESKGLFGTEDNYDLAYLLGWYHSDGTQHEDRTFIDLWENSFDKLDEIHETFTRVYSAYGGNTYNIKNQTGRVVGERHRETPKFSDCVVRTGSQAKKRLGTNLFSKNNLGFKKGEIPDWIWRSDERTQWRYVQSLLEGDGSVYIYDCPEKGSPIQLYYASVDINFLKQLQRLMYNLGIRPAIYKGRAGGPRLMPDGKGGQKLYETKQCYKLAIGNKPDCVKVNQMTGFLDRKGVKLELSENYRDNTRNYSPVESIEFHSNQDVYCPTVETDEHVFVCNGIQTFNCSEVSLIDTADESFVCCLSSLNLELYDEWKNTDTVKLAIYFLDAVMSEFIENSAGIPGLEAVNKFARRHRALGLGKESVKCPV